MPSPVRFADVKWLLERAGWRIGRVNGSHHIFVKSGCPHLSIPVHKGLVKHGYYKEAQKRAEESNSP